MIHLSDKKCVACEGGTPPLNEKEIAGYMAELGGNWEVVDLSTPLKAGYKKIKKEFKFKDFKEAMAFVDKIAEIAEAEGHHPDIHIFYNRVNIELWTHAVNGLSENDFILAAKIDKIV